MDAEEQTKQLLDHIYHTFYGETNKRTFYRDRKMLLHAISLPAAWADERGVVIPADRYREIICGIISDIHTHGDPSRYQYLPRYLLKCVQDYLAHHGDVLYDALKHIRNRLQSIETILARATSPDPPDHDPQSQTQQVLAQTHRLIHPPRKKKQEPADKKGNSHEQLELF